MSYKVTLTYFKRSGKWYGEETYETDKTNIFDVHEEVKDMRFYGTLPGISGSGNQFMIHVEVDGPFNVPKILI